MFQFWYPGMPGGRYLVGASAAEEPVLANQRRPVDRPVIDRLAELHVPLEDRSRVVEGEVPGIVVRFLRMKNRPLLMPYLSASSEAAAGGMLPRVDLATLEAELGRVPSELPNV